MSDDFKELGTLNKEGRQSDYYPGLKVQDKIMPPPQYFGAEGALADAGYTSSMFGVHDMQNPNQSIELTGVGSNRAVVHPIGNNFTQ